MIRRIVACTLLVCLFIAIPLSIMGFEKVELGAPFLSLMKTTTLELERYKIAIPFIPKIPLQQYESPAWYENVLNFLIKFVNGLSTVLNFIITGLNTLIELLEFIFLLLRNLKGFRDSLRESEPHQWRVMAIALSNNY